MTKTQLIMTIIISMNVGVLVRFLYLNGADTMNYINLLGSVIFGMYLVKELKVL